MIIKKRMDGAVTVRRVGVNEARAAGMWPPACVDEAREAALRFGSGMAIVLEPYRAAKRAEAIRQGKDRPRPLTFKENELVRKNRRIARENLAAMESWYRAEVKEPLSGAALRSVRGGPEDKVLKGITFGDKFWKPRVW
jgi:hypothetical protein